MESSAPPRGALRLQILSDLHAEVAPDRLPLAADLAAGADAAVLAGDLARAPDSVAVAAALFPEAPLLVLVAGNHEGYATGLDIDAGLDAMRLAAARASSGGRRVLVLEDEAAVAEVGGVPVRFLGCTLWTDYALFGAPERHGPLAHRCLNDHRMIRGRAGGMLALEEVVSRFAASRAFLARALEDPFDGPTVVVTHHLPSMRSVAPHYRRDPVSAGFASRCDDLVAKGAALWVHGHTHASRLWRDRSGTLVACNPCGYPRPGGKRENPDFDPRFLVDLRRGAPDGLWRAGRAKPPPALGSTRADSGDRHARRA